MTAMNFGMSNKQVFIECVATPGLARATNRAYVSVRSIENYLV